MVTKAEVAQQFGKQAAHYATSVGHAKGDDLALVVGLANTTKAMTVLDIATGAGHTACAIAPNAAIVMATDLAPQMVCQAEQLAKQKNLDNVVCQQMDAEELGYQNELFHVVTCRIAPHHFINVRKAVCEVARVLKMGGAFVLEDNISPAIPRLDSFINLIERLRDPTHVRSYRRQEWFQFLQEAGLKVVYKRNYRKKQDIAKWIEISGISAEQASLVYLAFDCAADDVRRHFRIEYDAHGKAISFTDNKIILRALKK